MNETELDSQTGTTLLDYFKLIPGIILATQGNNTPSPKVENQAPAQTNWKPLAYIGGGIVLLLVLIFALKK